MCADFDTMLRIIVIVSLLHFACAIPFESPTTSNNGKEQYSIHSITIKKPVEEVYVAEGIASSNKNTQPTIVVEDSSKSKDVHKKHENIFEKMFHHKDETKDTEIVEEINIENEGISGQSSSKSHKPEEKKHLNLFGKNVDNEVHLVDSHHGNEQNGPKSGDGHEKHENFLKKVIHNTGTAIKNTEAAINHGTKKIINNTGEAIKDTGEAIHDGTGKLVKNTGEGIKKTEEGIKKTTKEVVEKGKKIIKGEEPIADFNINSGMKILDNEVRVQGEVKIGFGHQTGAHGSASANVLGQQAHVNADVLNSPALDSPTSRH